MFSSLKRIACCGIPFGSAAAEVYQLNPIVVTAKREAVPILETPASVDVIEAEDIRTSGASNIFDVLRLSNGISSFSYGANGQSWGGNECQGKYPRNLQGHLGHAGRCAYEYERDILLG